MKTDVLEFQNMMNDFVFVSTIQISLTFKGNQTFLIFNPPYCTIEVKLWEGQFVKHKFPPKTRRNFKSFYCSMLAVVLLPL